MATPILWYQEVLKLLDLSAIPMSFLEIGAWMVFTINKDPRYACHLIADPGRYMFYEFPREPEGLCGHLRSFWN